MNMTTAETLVAISGSEVDFSIPDHSFSPHYSDIGLGFDGSTGISQLFFHYNRGTTVFGEPFMTFHADGEMASEERTVLGVTQTYDSGARVEISGYDRNAFVIVAEGIGDIEFLFTHDEKLTEARTRATEQGAYLYEGYLPARDKREPDETFPIIMGVQIHEGSAEGCGLDTPLTIRPAESGRIVMVFTANALEIDEESVIELLQAVPESTDAAREATMKWLATTIGDLDITGENESESKVLAESAYTLAFDACRAPGRLANRVSIFPARGSYAMLAPWDSCFHNLALEYMEPCLAEDSLLLLTDTMRADGKISCFVASTWERPLLSQPALVGWAAERLVRQRGDVEYARNILPKMWRNCQWWLTQRMTRYGVIGCPHGIEAGWDNSPRWDKGPILACDMNSHLLLQLRVSVRFARAHGEAALAKKIAARADQLAERMLDVLYDPEENIFKDVVVETGEQLSIRTPAAFLPLLAEVGLAEDKARAMIENVLLNPDKLFGKYPFPSVAYDEPTYDAPEYWRGPTWMPVGYLMLETLSKFGYEAERREATKRLYNMVIEDGGIREWFDSTTGAGLGAHQQAWTAAILLRLRKEMAAWQKRT